MPTRLISMLLTPLFLLLCACGSVDAEPAIWRVDRTDAPDGAAPAGYLFGTIHALPPNTKWHGDTLNAALADAGVLMVEIENLDRGKAQAVFQSLAIDMSLPPLPERIAPDYRDELAEVLAETGAKAETFHHVETWAAALTLSSLLQAKSSLDPDNGVDAALIADWPGRVVAFETTEEQLRIFDQLSGDEQQALLETMVAQADDVEPEALADAWRDGNAEKLARLLDMGLDASPALRAALLGRRNARWIGRIVTELEAGNRPFVAVGAGHIEGPDGLIALLAQRGWTATRIQ